MNRFFSIRMVWFLIPALLFSCNSKEDEKDSPGLSKKDLFGIWAFSTEDEDLAEHLGDSTIKGYMLFRDSAEMLFVNTDECDLKTGGWKSKTKRISMSLDGDTWKLKIDQIDGGEIRGTVTIEDDDRKIRGDATLRKLTGIINRNKTEVYAGYWQIIDVGGYFERSWQWYYSDMILDPDGSFDWSWLKDCSYGVWTIIEDKIMIFTGPGNMVLEINDPEKSISNGFLTFDLDGKRVKSAITLERK